MEQNQITEQEIAHVLEVVKKIGYVNWTVCNKELSSPSKATAMLHILQKRGIIQEIENGELTVNTNHTDSEAGSTEIIANTKGMCLSKEKTMNNKTRKKKVIKWLLVGIACVVILGITHFMDGIWVGVNQMRMEHGAPRMSLGSPFGISIMCGYIFSVLGICVSVLMFIISLVSCWVNSTPTVIRQGAEENSDTLIQLSKLYKEGLLTKQEFETKKKQLLGVKMNGSTLNKINIH